MKKQLLIPALIALSVLYTQAETCVWKVEKDGATLYLGGTFHLLRPADFPLPPEFDTAYKSSDLLIFETDLAAMNSIATQQKIMASGMYTDGTTLANHLKPETFKLLSNHCASKGLPVAMVQAYKPSIAMLTILTMELMEIGVSTEGVDTTLHKKAVADKKPVKSLETLDQQMDMLLKMGSDDPDGFVVYSLADLEKARREFPIMINAWKTGDTSGLENFVITPLQKLPAIYKSIIVDRNNAWLKKIPEWKTTKEVEFVLVGAAHLLGPDGILAALQKDRWKIEKLNARTAR